MIFLYQLQELDLELGDLPMNSLLAAAFITYLCDAREDLRIEYLAKWGAELSKTEFDFCKFLSSERDLLQWQALGLPSDRLSQENAIMIFQVSLYFTEFTTNYQYYGIYDDG